MTYPTEKNMMDYPHVYFTSDVSWDPSILDDENNLETSSDKETYRQTHLDRDFNDFGELNALCDERNAPAGELMGNLDYDIDLLLYEVHQSRQQCQYDVFTSTSVNAHTLDPHFPNFELLHPNFGWIPESRIENTLHATTQFGRAVQSFPFRRHFKTRFPAANVAQDSMMTSLWTQCLRMYRPTMMAYLNMVIVPWHKSTVDAVPSLLRYMGCN
jgi:hypothetical protein